MFAVYTKPVGAIVAIVTQGLPKPPDTLGVRLWHFGSVFLVRAPLVLLQLSKTGGYIASVRKMATSRQLAKIAFFSGSMVATGNVIAQSLTLWSERAFPVADIDSTVVDHKVPASSYDPLQTLRFFAYGVAFSPVSYRWHAFLNARFPLGNIVAGSSKQIAAPPSKMPLSHSTRAVLKRLVVDQTLFAPIATFSFVGGMGVMEGLGPVELAERFRIQYLAVLMAGYALWPAAQLINFSIVPLAYRVPFSSVVGLMWHTYLSWTSARIKAKGPPSEIEQADALGPVVPATN
ncbi:hypothetical protein GGI18_003465 [Coemansia linderi]|uniref:Uncharacterized protein n=1 Tax=Coemansia linderi TaxID=2663919 RepID=A0ACC1KC90_9FUNG|nr:hypothetical protein GGI18_003465 [Coemansia linderi]